MSRGGMGEQFGAWSIRRTLGGEGWITRDVVFGPAGWGVLSRVRSGAPKRFETDVLDAARRAAAVDDPHVARVVDAGTEAGVAYYVHAHEPGRDLRALYNAAFHRARSLPLPLTVRIIADAAHGLGEAARQADGAPHGEVSPRHILVGFDGLSQIAELFVAQAHERALGGPRATGRFSYRAPEMLQGRPVDGRSDVFALGVVLFETTTGTRLFKRRDPEATRQAVLSGDVPSPAHVLEGYPAELERVVRCALEPSPVHRFASCGELAEALERFLRGEPPRTTRARVGDLLNALFPADDGGSSAPVGSPGSPGEPAREPPGGAPGDPPDSADATPPRGPRSPTPSSRREPGSDSGLAPRRSDRPALSLVERADGISTPRPPPVPEPPSAAEPLDDAPTDRDPAGDPAAPPSDGARGGARSALGDAEGSTRPTDDRSAADRTGPTPDGEVESAAHAGPSSGSGRRRSGGARREAVARIPLSTENEAVEPALAETERIPRAPRPRSSRRRLRVLGLVVAVGGLGAAGWWAAQPGAPPAPADPGSAAGANSRTDSPPREAPDPERRAARDRPAPDAPDPEGPTAAERALRGPAPAPRGGEPVGHLKIVVRPWGVVRVDGWRHGLSPLPVLDVPTGRHRVVVRNDDLDRTWTGEVDVAEGETETLVVDLAP